MQTDKSLCCLHARKLGLISAKTNCVLIYVFTRNIVSCTDIFLKKSVSDRNQEPSTCIQITVVFNTASSIVS